MLILCSSDFEALLSVAEELLRLRYVSCYRIEDDAVTISVKCKEGEENKYILRILSKLSNNLNITIRR